MSTTSIDFNSVTEVNNGPYNVDAVIINSNLAWEQIQLNYAMADTELDGVSTNGPREEFWLLIGNPEGNNHESDKYFVSPANAYNSGLLYEYMFTGRTNSNGLIVYPDDTNMYGCLIHAVRQWGNFTVIHPTTGLPVSVANPWVLSIPSSDGEYYMVYDETQEIPWSVEQVDEYKYGMFFRFEMVQSNYHSDLRPVLQSIDGEAALLYSADNYMYEFKYPDADGYDDTDVDVFPHLYIIERVPAAFI